MDKMGEWEPANNKGVPATPRDGANIEIIGLLKSTLRWLVNLHQNGLFSYQVITFKIDFKRYAGVNLRSSIFFPYSEWNNLLQQNFEKLFFIPINPEDDKLYHINKALVHRRGMYKDVLGCSMDWMDYQLRPNVCIAMTVVSLNQCSS